jgi:hypothetical protein
MQATTSKKQNQENAPYGEIPSTSSIEDALAFGGLDFIVETFAVKPVIDLDHIVSEDFGDEPGEDWIIPNYRGIRRADEKTVVFNVPSDSYTVVQNAEIFEFVRPLLEATGGFFTKVGSFKRGANIFAFTDRISPGPFRLSTLRRSILPRRHRRDRYLAKFNARKRRERKAGS